LLADVPGLVRVRRRPPNGVNLVENQDRLTLGSNSRQAVRRACRQAEHIARERYNSAARRRRIKTDWERRHSLVDELTNQLKESAALSSAGWSVEQDQPRSLGLLEHIDNTRGFLPRKNARTDEVWCQCIFEAALQLFD